MNRKVTLDHAGRFSVELLEKLPLLMLLIAVFTLGSSCLEKNEQGSSAIEREAKVVKTIENSDHFRQVLESAGDRLLVIDLYADWCPPCRILSPMLEEIAKENNDKASFYKMDVDKNPVVAMELGVSGIPYVVFARNEILLHSITGLQPKENYVRAINHFVQENSQQRRNLPGNGQ